MFVVGLVWWPVRPGATDGFPLSTYPMFGYARSTRSVVHTVLGVEADGRRRPLTPLLVGGTARPKHALSTAQNAVLGGRSRALCQEVLARVIATPPDEPIVAVEVVTETWNTLASVDPGTHPLGRSVHARCEVP